jgi:hypothetical protein
MSSILSTRPFFNCIYTLNSETLEKFQVTPLVISDYNLPLFLKKISTKKMLF